MGLTDFPKAKKLDAVYQIDGRLFVRCTDKDAKANAKAIRAIGERQKRNGDLEYVVQWFIPMPGVRTDNEIQSQAAVAQPTNVIDKSQPK